MNKKTNIYTLYIHLTIILNRIFKIQVYFNHFISSYIYIYILVALLLFICPLYTRSEVIIFCALRFSLELRKKLTNLQANRDIIEKCMYMFEQFPLITMFGRNLLGMYYITVSNLYIYSLTVTSSFRRNSRLMRP